MDDFRDKTYNLSDIVLTIIIILVAFILISWRVMIIMHYGTYDSSDTSTNVQITDSTGSGSSSSSASSGSSGSSSASSGNAGISDSTSNSGVSDEEVVTYVITIEPRTSAVQVAQLLLENNLISDTDSFLTAVEMAGATTKLKAGTFNIPSNSTSEEIVSILTH